MAGIAIMLGSLAPMFGIGGQATVVANTLISPIAAAVGLHNDLSAVDIQGNRIGLGANVITDGPVNGVAFEMRIPAIGYSATVMEGVDSKILDRSPGHYPESAWPGQPGNVAVAAHNVYWLSFSQLTAGDRVEIQTRHGLYVYVIQGSKIVSPDDRSVLTQDQQHRLTLTTCWPLWAGAFATQRLVFFGIEIGGVG